MRAVTLQIDNGESLSDEAIRIAAKEGPMFARQSLVGIVMPADWTAADLTFQTCNTDDGTFQDYYNTAGTEVTVVAGADRNIGIDPADFVGVEYLKVRSGTSSAAVNQGADRVITFLLREVA